ncbi:MAG: hypothetical protein ABI367_12940 [Mucilaginibacter sp.]
MADFSYSVPDEYEQQGISGNNILVNNVLNNFNVTIEEIDISGMNETQLAEYIYVNQIWFIIKGIKTGDHANSGDHELNIHTVLNRVRCPLLLIPENWVIKVPERLAYLADLRYCRLQIMRFLADFAKPFNADVLLAHLSAKGLPQIEENYALSIFNEEINGNVNYSRLLFNNIKQRDLNIAVDVLTHGMHNDMLVMVNHRFHFEEIIGRYLTNHLPANITVPLLLFPY